MREIKFRAWISDASVLSDINRIESNFEGPKWLHTLKPVDRPYEFKRYGQSSKRIAAHRAVLMQYTGLTDKNGVEIYEGDILEYISPEEDEPPRDKYVVEWFGHGFTAARWKKGAPQRQGIDGLVDCDQDMRVIGNIYENPELLEATS